MDIKQQNETEIYNKLIKVTPDSIKGAHDSQMVIVNDNAYIVYECNDTRPGESNEWDDVYSALSIIDLKRNKLLKVLKVAAGGQSFKNIELYNGCCFVPRILQIDNNYLRIFFYNICKKEQYTTTWYRDFDINTNTLAVEIHQVFMETAFGVYPMTSKVFHEQAVLYGFQKPESLTGPYLLDMEKGYPEKKHLIVNNFFGQQNALCKWNNTFDTIIIIGNINEPQSEGLSEASAEILPDGRWGAIIRNDNPPYKYMFASSDDGILWKQACFCEYFTNSSNSKPIFYKFEDYYFLGWQEKPCRTKFNIEVSKDCIHWIRLFSFDNAEFSLQYPCLSMKDRMIFICATHGYCGNSIDKRDSIWFGKLISLDKLKSVWNTFIEKEMNLWP